MYGGATRAEQIITLVIVVIGCSTPIARKPVRGPSGAGPAMSSLTIDLAAGKRLEQRCSAGLTQDELPSMMHRCDRGKRWTAPADPVVHTTLRRPRTCGEGRDPGTTTPVGVLPGQRMKSIS